MDRALEGGGSRGETLQLLEALVRRWPETAAARRARLWLLDEAHASGRWREVERLGGELEADTTLGRGERAAIGSLLRLAQSMTRQSNHDSTSESTSDMAPSSEASDLFGRWLRARLDLQAAPGDEEALRAYLGLEGSLRAAALAGLWVSGLAASPPGSRARAILGASLGGWERELRGALEESWIRRRVEGP